MSAIPTSRTPRLDSLTKPVAGKAVSLHSGLEFIRPIAAELSLKWLGNSMLGLFDRLDTIIKPEKPSSDLDKEKSLEAWNLDLLMLKQLFNHSQRIPAQMISGNNLFKALEPLSNHDKPNDESEYNPFDDLVEDCAMNINGDGDQEALIKALSILKKCRLDKDTVKLFQDAIGHTLPDDFIDVMKGLVCFQVIRMRGNDLELKTTLDAIVDHIAQTEDDVDLSTSLEPDDPHADDWKASIDLNAPDWRDSLSGSSADRDGGLLDQPGSKSKSRSNNRPADQLNPLVTFAKAMTLIVDLYVNKDDSAQKLAQVLKTALCMKERDDVQVTFSTLFAIGQVLEFVYKQRGETGKTPMDKLLSIFDIALNRMGLLRGEEVPERKVREVCLTMRNIVTN